ncbi:MAG: DMT family transporter [Bryobacterales bacterium]|nr:DMT family transporter [Bryobacterales bacterium]
MSAGDRHLRAELAIAAVAFLWGATFIIVKNSLNDASTFLFLSLRFTMATALLWFVLRNRLRRKGPSDWRGGLLCGFFLFLGYVLQTAGLRLTTASNSAFITGLYVVLVPLLGSLVNRSKPRLVEITGAVAALIGTGLMTSPMTSVAMGMRFNTGDLLTAACALAFAGHILSVAHYSKTMDYERLSLYQVGGVALLSWLGASFMEPVRVVWTGRLWFGLLSTAILATALSFLLYTWAQKHTTAARSALIFALEPVFAGLTAWIVAGEAWTARSLAGAALILAGIVLVEVKPARPAGHQLG